MISLRDDESDTWLKDTGGAGRLVFSCRLIEQRCTLAGNRIVDAERTEAARKEVGAAQLSTLFQQIVDREPADTAVVRARKRGHRRHKVVSQEAETKAGDDKRRFGPTFEATQRLAMEEGGNTLFGEFYRTARAEGDAPVGRAGALCSCTVRTALGRCKAHHGSTPSGWSLWFVLELRWRGADRRVGVGAAMAWR